MFEGYLKLGENELGNWERTRGYAESGDCPIRWLERGECNSLSDVLGDTIYDRGAISLAPWFDADVPESARFYGAHIVSVKGDADSTRERGITEGVTNGGVAGRERRAGRQFRVRAWLTAAGGSALDYGMGWLDRALSGAQCSRHGASCAGADLEFFTECPPERQLVPDLSPWTLTRLNRFMNPSFERVIAGAGVFRRNECPDPTVTNAAIWNRSGSITLGMTPAGKTAFVLNRVNSSVIVGMLNTAYRRPVIPNAPIAFSAEGIVGQSMRLSLDLIYYNAAGANVGTSPRVHLATSDVTDSGVVVAEPGVPTRFGRTTTPPAEAATYSIRIFIDNRADGIAYATDFLVENRPGVLPFFYNGTVDDTAFTYEADGVTSVAKASINELRRNYATDPSGKSPAQWNSTGSLTSAAAITDFPGPVTTAVRFVGTGSTPTAAAYFGCSATLPVSTTIAFRFRLRTDVKLTGVTVKHRPIGTTSGEGSATIGDILPGTYEFTGTLTTTATAPTSSSSIGIRYSSADASPTIDITELSVEVGSTTTYFTGDITPDADLAPSWVGTPDRSASALSFVGVSKAATAGSTRTAYRSHDWASRGRASLKVLNFGGSIDSFATLTDAFPGAASQYAGKTFTLLGKIRLTAAQTGTQASTARGFRLSVATPGGTVEPTSGKPGAPNVAGVHEVRTIVTLPADMTAVNFLRVYNGEANGLPVYWDELAVIEGAYDGSYFDGYFTDADPSMGRYAWTGTPNDSTSTYETRVPIERMQTDAEYAAVVDPLRRFAHDVKVISGPFEVSTRESSDGIHVGREVEYTLYAEQGWIYGKPSPVNIPPILPVVVDDIPVNLVPYPSAELGINEVTVAVNHATNPSLELDAVGWSGARYAGDGTATVSVAGSRVVGERAFSGSASYRLRMAGSSTATPGQGSLSSLVEAQVSLAGLAAGSKISLHIWGALVFVSGPTSLSGSTPPRLSGVYRFYNAAGAPLAAPATIANAEVSEFGGRAFSLADVTIPTGAASVRVGIDTMVPVQNSTTPELNSDVRVYADAVAVTVP